MPTLSTAVVSDITPVINAINQYENATLILTSRILRADNEKVQMNFTKVFAEIDEDDNALCISDLGEQYSRPFVLDIDEIVYAEPNEYNIILVTSFKEIIIIKEGVK